MNEAAQKKKQAKEARRYRHYWRLMRALARPFVRWRVGFSWEPAPEIEAPVLVLANHNTDLDPVLVSLSFGRQMFFVASEHIFRWGWISKLLVYLFRPIPRVKGGSDVRAAMEIVRTLRKGDNICVFAEGNRSVDGQTGAIYPATGTLAKCGADLVTYRLEGGYFTHPRWARSMRKGHMRGYVVGHYTAAELKDMTVEAVNEVIRRDLHEDAYARQEERPVAFRGKWLAESLETALYRCPVCGGVSTMHSEGNCLTCACGLSLRYTETGYLEGENAPFTTITQWYAWQKEQVDSWLESTKGDVICQDEAQTLYSVEPCVRATPIAQGTLRLTRETLSLGAYVFPLADIAELTIVGQMTMTFLADGCAYEIKSEMPRSGYKYIDAFEALRKNNEGT